MQRLHLRFQPPLMLMMEQSALSRGVGHKLNVIRAVENFFLQTQMRIESVGMKGVCCNYFIFSYTCCLYPPGPTSPKQIKIFLMNNNKAGHLSSSDICAFWLTMVDTSAQYFALGLTQASSRHVFLVCILRTLTSDSFKQSTLEAIQHILAGGSVDLTWESVDIVPVMDYNRAEVTLPTGTKSPSRTTWVAHRTVWCL